MNVLNDMHNGYKMLRNLYKNSSAKIGRLKMFNELLTEEKQCLKVNIKDSTDLIMKRI